MTFRVGERVAVLAVAAIGVVCIAGCKAHETIRKPDEIRSLTIPPDAEPPGSEDDPSRPGRGWRFETTMTWDSYSRWLKQQLPEFSFEDLPPVGAQLKRISAGDVQRLQVQWVARGSKLIISIQYLAYPF